MRDLSVADNPEDITAVFFLSITGKPLISCLCLQTNTGRGQDTAVAVAC